MRVAVLYGGKSGEHDVSLLSAASLIQAMDCDRYEVVPVWIDSQGDWQLGEKAISALEGKLEPHTLQTLREELPNRAVEEQLQGHDPISQLKEIDAVFPVLHGTYGEDGTVQGLLEILDIPYVGSGVMASAVGMDKGMMKKVFAQEGLPQGDFVPVWRSRLEREPGAVLDELEARFGYPLFVKPASLGSSVGISKAKDRESLAQALRVAADYDRKIIVEEFIDAQEVEVAVLGNDEVKASVPGEIVASNDFYDYKAKYIDGKSVMRIPAELSSEKTAEIRQLALRAYQAIECSGLARVDFFITRGSGRILLNEVNTMPGFTQHSMYANLWKESGLDYPELVNQLIELALERYRDKKKNSTQFEVE